jgi:hypothetical protein
VSVPSSEFRTPTPSPASECVTPPPPGTKGEGTHSPAGKGVRVRFRTTGVKALYSVYAVSQTVCVLVLHFAILFSQNGLTVFVLSYCACYMGLIEAYQANMFQAYTHRKGEHPCPLPSTQPTPLLPSFLYSGCLIEFIDWRYSLSVIQCVGS